MTDQTPENTQLFLTAAMPCPYLPGQAGAEALHAPDRPARVAALHHLLSENGFRRSQNLIYRPACEGCSACQSVRIVAGEFELSARYRRVLQAQRRHRGRGAASRGDAPSSIALFKRYLEARHAGGGMTQMSFVDYEYMVEDTPVQIGAGRVPAARRMPEQPLVAVALTDVMPDGLSMVYSFYDPDLAPAQPRQPS